MWVGKGVEKYAIALAPPLDRPLARGTALRWVVFERVKVGSFCTNAFADSAS